MANEITVQTSLRADKNNVKFSGGKSYTADWSATSGEHKTVTVGTSEQAVTFIAATTTKQFLWMRNMDEENFVDIGPDDTTLQPLIRLLPGESFVIPIVPDADIKAQADTAAVDLEVLVINQ